MTPTAQAAVRFVACAFALAALAACGGRGGEPVARGKSTSGPASGDVLEVVDSMPVRLDDVRGLQSASGLSAREALARLEAEALLMAEAERRGYGARREVARVTEQATVQAYLDDEAAKVQVPAADVAARYQKDIARYRFPERRTSVHALAPLPRDRTPTADEEAAARRFAEDALLAASVPGVDPAAVLESLRGRALPYQAAIVERLPPVASDAALVKPFLEALFAAPGTGPLSRPVRTMFGWHAIVVTEVAPAHQVSLEQATPELTAALELEARTANLTTRIERLQATHKVEWASDHRERLAEPNLDE